MGQMTFGLCYGVPGDPVEEEKLEEYRSWMAPRIAAIQMRGVSYWDAQNRVVPRFNSDGTLFLGFFIAVGASGMAGLPTLEGLALNTLDAIKRYQKPMKAAANAWAKFADWCDGRGIHLAEPQLWLVECEVG
jgi:hypothetical protein